ncbi:hypothetical protein T4D_10588 [Trichinella pseudospiralis]|uniref:Uncharacterized protein n=1 Tax=Trichinella pseudospiralis TaxID=6337 RepID=A0A0V1FAL2_TRIPS|nr:hypothetical protein T4D_10588 [Trichinella pseudospiralis]
MLHFTTYAAAVTTNVAVGEELTSFIAALLQFLPRKGKTVQICITGIYFGNLLASEMNKRMINDRIESGLRSS